MGSRVWGSGLRIQRKEGKVLEEELVHGHLGFILLLRKHLPFIPAPPALTNTFFEAVEFRQFGPSCRFLSGGASLSGELLNFHCEIVIRKGKKSSIGALASPFVSERTFPSFLSQRLYLGKRCILGDIRPWVGDPSTFTCRVSPHQAEHIDQ